MENSQSETQNSGYVERTLSITDKVLGVIDNCSKNVMDVFQVVKAQRIQKPGLVLT